MPNQRTTAGVEQERGGVDIPDRVIKAAFQHEGVFGFRPRAHEVSAPCPIAGGERNVQALGWIALVSIPHPRHQQIGCHQGTTLLGAHRQGQLEILIYCQPNPADVFLYSQRICSINSCWRPLNALFRFCTLVGIAASTSVRRMVMVFT